MRKKRLTTFIILILILSVFSGTIGVSADTLYKENPNVSIDGNIIVFQNGMGSPFVDDNYRTQVPLRGAMEAFGANVSWDQNSGQAVIVKDGIIVKVPLWTSYILKNDIKIDNDTESVAINERIYLPIRVVLEAFGAEVSYDYTTKTVVVKSNKKNNNSANKPDFQNHQHINNDEMKAMWISYLEFQKMPKSKKEFENEIDRMFDDIKKMKMNAVIVQLRPFADAMYPSEYFPWSKFAGGIAGKNPGYDPTNYMVNAAHKRGLEFHAWVNPYRIGGSGISSIMNDSRYSDWYAKRWILQHKGAYYFNPAIAEARNLIIAGVKEIVDKYQVDGIHFDDYFYPSLGGENFDKDEYLQSGSNLSLDNWRRNNVNMLISNCYSIIKLSDPKVVFGISPAGNIDNLKSNSSHFVDIDRWMSKSGYIDYIMPQLYWGFEAKNSKGNIAPWAYENNLKRWIALKNKGDVKLYIGLSLSYAGKPTKDGNNISEWLRYNDIIARQVQYARNTGSVSGFAFFRYNIFGDSLAINEATNLINIL